MNVMDITIDRSYCNFVNLDFLNLLQKSVDFFNLIRIILFANNIVYILSRLIDIQ